MEIVVIEKYKVIRINRHPKPLISDYRIDKMHRLTCMLASNWRITGVCSECARFRNSLAQPGEHIEHRGLQSRM